MHTAAYGSGPLGYIVPSIDASGVTQRFAPLSDAMYLLGSALPAALYQHLGVKDIMT